MKYLIVALLLSFTTTPTFADDVPWPLTVNDINIECASVYGWGYVVALTIHHHEQAVVLLKAHNLFRDRVDKNDHTYIEEGLKVMDELLATTKTKKLNWCIEQLAKMK